MFKKSDGKRRRSKRRSKRSKRCKALLGKKIGINIREGIYANKAQAIAVAYSQVRKRHPSCRRILGKKSKKSKRSKRRRSMRRRINDGAQIVGTGNNGFLSEQQKQDFREIFTDFSTTKHFNNITLEKFRRNNTQPTGGATGTDYYENIQIKKHLNDNTYNIVQINRLPPDLPIIFHIKRIMSYELPSSAGAGAV